ncbi:MAG: hypothetical protein PHQ58_06695 [Rhodoferax sp.]|uniref:hypothetical protein n=1 Tax=Rhodoferax sp. TaxID=50421 RepID=UPI002638B7A9|nr:hypothetical protein [Rhodoferax sp.]MDD2880107.1 hypothetical protein [Rhodoferax sp.]
MAAAVSAQAQGMVTAAMGTRTVLKAYTDAEGKSETTALAVKDITFPLKVFEISEAGFVHVKVQSKDVWLDRGQIRIPPESLTVTCTTVDQSSANLTTAGIRGANSACK